MDNFFFFSIVGISNWPTAWCQCYKTFFIAIDAAAKEATLFVLLKHLQPSLICVGNDSLPL
jgi:hypothetical protein